MKFAQTLLICALFTTLYLTLTNAATFNITNQCTYTVWAAATPGGGKRLDSGQSWSLDAAPGTTGGQIWGRTNCSFGANGQGQCQTGDCGRLECQGYGKPPRTLAEFALNQFSNMDFIDISLVDGFNIPMEFSSITPCHVKIRCSGRIVEECPAELRTPGGCNNPCTVFGTNEYCCFNGPSTCPPTAYSRFFKERCPDVYNNPDQPSLLTCPSGTNYRVVFCP